ncbi:hypothetical protein [Oxalicibacterium solurbis]|uniref:Uncharacterized protein n=1 Tax=Oxalicibacterium solurbis TaxID=69280 RepID=A0A8J3B483_9BURK|nr:hypothetical protein [Oxalicibacterium solurbis]GGI54705.1 hypothetical protein GCM10011430_18790 [Oxalicibacterium solurbis]
MKDFFIRDGNLKEWIRIFLVIAGVGCAIVGISIGITSIGGCFFLFVGFFLAAVGGYAAQAHMLKIKPFDNEYENARKSYEEEKQE